MHISTKRAAQRGSIKAQTLRAAYCRYGHYFGIVPIKLPNGRLLWPADFFERLLSVRNGDSLTTSGHTSTTPSNKDTTKNKQTSHTPPDEDNTKNNQTSNTPSDKGNINLGEA